MRPDQELEATLESLRRTHDIAPVMADWKSVADLTFRELPEEMLSVLRQSPDWSEVEVGPPVWLQVEGEAGNLQLVVYRAKADGKLYVLGPATPTQR